MEGREREGPKLLLNQGPSEPCYTPLVETLNEEGMRVVGVRKFPVAFCGGVVTCQQRSSRLASAVTD